MALYYDAATILSFTQVSGSLKSRIYSNNTFKSKPAQIYALISETAKRDGFLKEVLENAEILEDEPKLTPFLALLLSHDHFFSRSGIAAPAKHPLRQAIERHKARLQAEFTRARLRRKCGSIEALKAVLDAEKGALVKVHPRWVRVNTIKAQNVEDVVGSLPTCKEKSSLSQVIEDTEATSYCHDPNVPDLFAFSPNIDLISTEAYNNGKIILQDKASCFPAHLLLGNQDLHHIGDMIDGCAAPGNKTTHLAAIAHKIGATGRTFACERDPTRSKTLQNMVAKAGASQVEVLPRQDFLALDPGNPQFSKVTHLLLDPSCSGSGILGREDVPKLTLPNDPRAESQPSASAQPSKNAVKTSQNSTLNKKRKRNGHVGKSLTKPARMTDITLEDTGIDTDANSEATPLSTKDTATQTRLLKLSNLQTLIVEHAMKFPAATKITYSTCSIHELENEVVVSRVLHSDVARRRGWRVLRREEQVEGLRAWKGRGIKVVKGDTAEVDVDGNDNEGDEYVNDLDEVGLEACIRCNPDDGEGTMGFFVCGFVREQSGDEDGTKDMQTKEEEEEEWEGFD